MQFYANDTGDFSAVAGPGQFNDPDMVTYLNLYPQHYSSDNQVMSRCQISLKKKV